MPKDSMGRTLPEGWEKFVRDVPRESLLSAVTKLVGGCAYDMNTPVHMPPCVVLILRRCFDCAFKYAS